MVSTNYTTVGTQPTNYGFTDPRRTDSLLLQSGDYLFLQDGSSHLLLEYKLTAGETNYTGQAINSTNYT